MTLTEYLYDRLSNHAGLTALVGDRISLEIAVQGTATPYVVFQRISGGRDYDHDGLEPMARSMWQFKVYGATALQAEPALAQVRLALDASESPAVGFYCYFENEFSIYESENRFRGYGLDCVLWFRQTSA